MATAESVSRPRNEIQWPRPGASVLLVVGMRIHILAIAMSVLSCATQLKTQEAEAPAAVVTPERVVSPAQPMGALRVARVEVADASLTAALAQWRMSTHQQHCVLVFGETQQWLLGCPRMNKAQGYSANASENVLGSASLWNPRSVDLGGKYIPYEQAKMGLVGTVVPYTSDIAGKQETSPVFVIQDWDALNKNHPGFQTSYLEEWLAIFVHEAFHGHQLWHPKVQAFAKSVMTGAVTPEDLAGFYNTHPDYQEAVKKEYELLRAAMEDRTADGGRARQALRDWRKLYTQRQAKFAPQLEAAFPGKHAWEMDGFETFLEGTARYTEANFLMSPPESAVASLSKDSTFHQFSETKGKWPTELPGLSQLGSKYFYSIGMYLSFLLDRADTGWKARLFDSDAFLIGQVDHVLKVQ